MAQEKYQSCIEACLRCMQECEHCAAACLKENDVKTMARCIALDQRCADICSLAARWMAAGSEFASQICRLCADVCKACGHECAKHTQMDHCKKCSEACFACEKACRAMA